MQNQNGINNLPNLTMKNKICERIIIVLVMLAAAGTATLYINENIPNRFHKLRAGMDAPAFSETRIVTNTADTLDSVCDADCSLRDALAVANPGALIQFAEGGQGVHQLETEILITKNNITIDGGEDHKVVLRGRFAEKLAQQGKITADNFICLNLKDSDNAISGLVVQNCRIGIASSGAQNTLADGTIDCSGGQRNRISNNYIGINEVGDGAAGNSMGVSISRAGNNVIGPGNVISGNLGSGIGIGAPGKCVTTTNRVEGNIIGLSADGSKVLRNERFGIEMTGAIATVIGGESAAERNIISGNKNGEIFMYFGSQFNEIVGNYIGLDTSGKKGITRRDWHFSGK